MITLLSLCGLSSCDFSEDDECPQYGTLIAYCNDAESVNQPKVEYQDKHLLYYPITGNAVHRLNGTYQTFTSDTLTRKLDVGEYDLLYYNLGNYNLRDYEYDIHSAVIYATTVSDTTGASVIEKEGEFVCSYPAFSQSIYKYRTTICEFQPRTLVKQLNFTLNLSGYVEEIDSVVCNLEGIAIGKNLVENSIINEWAQLHFPTKKEADVVYKKSVYVFGWVSSVDNILTVMTYHKPFEPVPSISKIDLTDLLETVKQDRIDIVLDVFVGNNGSIGKVTIDGWVEGDITGIIPQPGI